MLQNLKNELYYGLKTIKSILSGYTGIVQRQVYDGEYSWEDVNKDEKGMYYIQPYYLCLLFNNGRHIPLPLLVDADSSSYFLQKIFIKIFKKSLKKAIEDAIYFASESEIIETETEGFEEELI